MWHKAVALAVVALVVPTATSAQQWNAAQREVWSFEESCWQKYASKDMEAWRTCFHKDYVGWFSLNPTPTPFNEAIGRYFMEATPVRVYSLKPHHILIHGNVAIVHYSAFVVEQGPDGKDQPGWVHWTDIALKDGGSWSWIGDHGHR